MAWSTPVSLYNMLQCKGLQESRALNSGIVNPGLTLQHASVQGFQQGKAVSGAMVNPSLSLQHASVQGFQ